MKKLTEKQKEEIVQRVANGEHQCDVCKDYGVAASTISHVICASRGQVMEFRAKNTMLANFSTRKELWTAVGLLEGLRLATKEDSTDFIAEKVLSILHSVLGDEYE